MLNYIPKQGDIVSFISKGDNKIDAIVISKDIFNVNTNLIIVCPISTSENDYPTHYMLEDSKKIKGFVLCEQIRTLDYEKNNLKYIEKSSDNDLLSVIMLVNACIEN